MSKSLCFGQTSIWAAPPPNFKAFAATARASTWRFCWRPGKTILCHVKILVPAPCTATNWPSCWPVVIAASDAQGAIIFLGGFFLLFLLNGLWLLSTWMVAHKKIRWTLQGLFCLAFLFQIFGQREMSDWALEVFAYSHFDMSPMGFDRFFYGSP